MRVTRGTLTTLGILLSLAAWVTSLTFAAVVTKDRIAYGLNMLANGAMGPFVLNFAWYANPLYFLAICLTVAGRPQAAWWLALLATALSASTYAYDEIWFHEGFSTPVLTYGIGAYIWTLSMAFLLVAIYPMAAVPRQKP